MRRSGILFDIRGTEHVIFPSQAAFGFVDCMGRTVALALSAHNAVIGKPFIGAFCDWEGAGSNDASKAPRNALAGDQSF